MSLIPLQLQALFPATADTASRTAKAASEFADIKSLSLNDLIDRFVNGLVSLTINIVLAVAVFYIGKFIIRKIYGLLSGIMLKRHVDNSLTTFVLSFVRIVLYFILIVTVIGILGIETSSFLALFASAGVAIGMALSGTLQNFAGGVLILLLKPYRVGDYIEVQGFAGTVKEIQIFSTILLTPDNKSILIPNGGISTGSVNNFSREPYRRVDWSVGISYGDDVDTARAAILAILAADERVVKKYTDEIIAPAVPPGVDVDDPSTHGGTLRGFFHRHHESAETQAETVVRPDRSPTVVVDQLADSAVVLKVRAWTQSTSYWGVYFDMNERFYKQLPAAGINFPFPQLDVHVQQQQPQ